ncbi:NUDIX hydrolase [Mucilaginibacter hurinus]|uniref:GDP-mannose pyrophosphatase n=1 Tax=Mucilaginibacter hurinus TaxID=2201324 RepID=A0A367GMY0_9SPHI|nr:NUDIX hydrolase [Mucilaginibacter hurinus]RCH54041.1 NUDIX hydrolase [Mucilaginibacter hurinus]
MSLNNITKWTVLQEEDASPSTWFPIVRQTVQLAPDHVVDDYYLAPLGDVVQVLALTAANEVVLTRQYKHGLGEILLELPGGMQQKNTSVIQSALNELEEETGIKANANQLKSLGKIAINPTKLRQVTYGFIMFNAEFNSTQKTDATEHIQVVTLPAPQVLHKVMNGEIWVTDSMNFILKAARLYPEIFEKE